MYKNGCVRRTKWLNFLVVIIIAKMVSYTRKANTKVEVTNMTTKEVGKSII